jgi:hypothetical protein
MQVIPEAFHAKGFPLVQFDRPIYSDLMSGFVLGWGKELTLIHVMEETTFQLDGYAVFRNSDIKRWRPIGADDFLARAARLHKLRPSMPPGITFDAMSSRRVAITAAATAYPLITIHRERINKRVCQVGRLRRTTSRSLTLLEISPDAEWEAHEETYLLRDVTLLEFGGAYETLLARMAPALPR